MNDDKVSAAGWGPIRAPSMVARIDTCANEPAEMLLRFLAERDQQLAELHAKLDAIESELADLRRRCRQNELRTTAASGTWRD